MRRPFNAAVLFGFALGLSGAWAHGASDAPRLNKNGVALCADHNAATDSDCYDPVSYFEGSGPQKGRPEHRASFEGASYLFASEANRKAFLEAPAKYAPAFNGWCAYGVAQGKKISIDPLNYKVTGDKLFLFYKDFFVDTRKKWTKDEPGLLAKANQNWPRVRGQDEE